LTENGVSYEWEFGEGSTSSMTHPNNVYTESGTYDVTLIATDAKDCIDSITKPITILDEFYIYVPNAFTPDGNRYNNTFRVSTINIVSFDIQIFNRWGNLIFESNDYQDDWNGLDMNGNPVVEGVYFYTATPAGDKYIYRENDDENPYLMHGFVHVVRGKQ
jgi:gliding motility-associated-like protein